MLGTPASLLSGQEKAKKTNKIRLVLFFACTNTTLSETALFHKRQAPLLATFSKFFVRTFVPGPSTETSFQGVSTKFCESSCCITTSSLECCFLVALFFTNWNICYIFKVNNQSAKEGKFWPKLSKNQKIKKVTTKKEKKKERKKKESFFFYKC